MKNLLIIGASGHGKVVADIAKLNGYKTIYFLDDDKNVKQCGSYDVIGTSFDADRLEGDVFVAIGNAVFRKRFSEKYKVRLTTLIHPGAVIAEDVQVGKGTVIMAGAVINSGTVIGNGCIINTGSTIDHDCDIGDYVHVAVGAHLCGTVEVGNNTWIGAGAIVSNNIVICNSCTLGAGAVVVKNICEQGTYVGVPAKELEMQNCAENPMSVGG